MRKLKRVFLWLAGIAVFGYAGLVVALYVMQRDMLYVPPQKFRTAPAAAGFPQAQEVLLDTADREKVIAWHVPPKGERPIVVFFHGNGDSIALRTPRFRELTSDGTGLFALSFRGYAGSSGEPTEQGLLNDAEAAYAYVAARYSKERIALWGYSLGTGPAVVLAAKYPIGKLALEAPYTSTADVAATIFPFIPIHLLMKDQYRSYLSIGKISAPLLVMHGERDQAIPFEFGKRMFELAPQPKRFVAFPFGRHENLEQYGVVKTVKEFLYGTADAGK